MVRVFEAVFDRVAGLDVHKAQVTACVRVPDAAGQRVAHLAEFATTVQGLLALAVGAGLQVLGTLMEESVVALAGPKGKHNPTGPPCGMVTSTAR